MNSPRSQWGTTDHSSKFYQWLEATLTTCTNSVKSLITDKVWVTILIDVVWLYNQIVLWRKISNIRRIKSPNMFLISSCICLCAIHWCQVLSWEWRYSWSSADRRCSNHTSEWSTSLLPIKVPLTSEVGISSINSYYHCRFLEGNQQHWINQPSDA